MIQRRGCASFLLESMQVCVIKSQLIRQKFEGHLTPELHVLSPVHLSHTSGAQRSENLITTQNGPYLDRHQPNASLDFEARYGGDITSFLVCNEGGLVGASLECGGPAPLCHSGSMWMPFITL